MELLTKFLIYMYIMECTNDTVPNTDVEWYVYKNKIETSYAFNVFIKNN